MDITLAMRAFVRTVERGSVTAAARDLGVSQPAVSKLLRKLESETRTRLIERNSRALRPTPQGLDLYREAAGALSSLDAAIEAARGRSSALEGTLRLHGPVCLGERQIQDIVAAFQDRHPGVSVHLTLENRPVDLIRAGVDLAFALERPSAEATVCRRLGVVRRLLVAAPAYLAGREAIVEPGQLAAHPILATDAVLGSGGTIALRRDGQAVEVPVRAALVTNNARVLLDAIAAGRGIGTAQAHMVSRELADGRLIRVLSDHELKRSDLFLVYPSAKHLRPAVRSFIDVAVDALRAFREADGGAVADI